MSLFSERLVTRRNRLGLTQEDLAEKAAVSKRSISDYETGKSEPSLEQLRKLAHALQCSTDWLLGDNSYDAKGRGGSIMHGLEQGQRQMVTSTLDALRSQATAMVSQLDLLMKQVAAEPSSKPVSDAARVGGQASASARTDPGE